jgi:methyltransferase OMS1
VVKPDGKVLLLEHGQSSWTYLANWMEKKLLRHVHKFGCYWNRDIEKIVKEAGLSIVECKRSQLGTVYYIVASPKPSSKT